MEPFFGDTEESTEDIPGEMISLAVNTRAPTEARCYEVK